MAENTEAKNKRRSNRFQDITLQTKWQISVSIIPLVWLFAECGPSVGSFRAAESHRVQALKPDCLGLGLVPPLPALVTLGSCTTSAPIYKTEKKTTKKTL